MPFRIVRNDITLMQVDAIVNTANPKPVVGVGTDSAIHQKAGPALLKARQAIGSIAAGDAAVTPAFDLNAGYVIHTVGPVWRGGLFGEEKKLRSCYERSLQLAVELGCRSIAFPLISTGVYGFPRNKALQIAISAFSSFLMDQEMDIYLVVYDTDSYKLSGKLVQDVAAYIDDHYVQTHTSTWNMVREIDGRESAAPPQAQVCRSARLAPLPKPGMFTTAAAPISLEDMLKRQDAGFSETVLRLIDETGKKDSEIYKRANMSKQHFSKLRNDPEYKPKKTTAIALALALELDMEKTKDLLGRAGFTLSNSSKFDLIIRYFIEHKSFDIIQINLTLYEFDQPLLGS